MPADWPKPWLKKVPVAPAQQLPQSCGQVVQSSPQFDSHMPFPQLVVAVIVENAKSAFGKLTDGVGWRAVRLLLSAVTRFWTVTALALGGSTEPPQAALPGSVSRAQVEAKIEVVTAELTNCAIAPSP